MIDRAEILRLANEFGLEARIVEKDYIRGWALGYRTYRVDRIRGARITQQTFAPSYAVELAPTASRG